MLKQIIPIVLIPFLISCSKPNGLFMQTASTMKIMETDTQDSILMKAAHIVPTPNQFEALKNEFIAFIHFGGIPPPGSNVSSDRALAWIGTISPCARIGTAL